MHAWTTLASPTASVAAGNVDSRGMDTVVPAVMVEAATVGEVTLVSVHCLA